MENQHPSVEDLINATEVDNQASCGIQSISGHYQGNRASVLIKNLKHIQKEAQEGIDALQKAIGENRDLTQDETKEVRDAYADVRVLLDGAGQMATFPFQQDYIAVLSSLLTRFDLTEEDAIKTQEKYKSLEVETRIHKDQVTGYHVNIVVSSNDEGEYPEGKWLKSYKFEQPTFVDSDVVVL